MTTEQGADMTAPTREEIDALILRSNDMAPTDAVNECVAMLRALRDQREANDLSSEPARSRALVAMRRVYEAAPRVTVYTMADMLDAAMSAQEEK